MYKPTPWPNGPASGLIWSNLAGLAGILGAYLALSTTPRPSTQLAWVAVAVAAATLAGVGNGMWLSASARTVRARRRSLMERATSIAAMPPEAAGSPEPATETESSAGPVAVANTLRFHRPGCVLVSGKAVISQGAGTHRSAGRYPCEICRPGDPEPTTARPPAARIRGREA